MNIKERLIALIGETEGGKYSNIVLGAFFREQGLSAGERGFATEVFYGVLRRKPLLDALIALKTKEVKKDWLRQLLRISLYQLLFMESDDKGVVWEATELSKAKFGVPVGRFINGVLRSVQQEAPKLLAEIKAKAEPVYWSFPEWIYRDLQARYPDDLPTVLTYLKRTPKMSFRVNRLRSTPAAFEDLLAREGIGVVKQVDAVYYTESGSLLHTPEFARGEFTVQDAASYLAAKNLGATPDDIVLDACSAPGGKLAVLAECMENRGELTALDIYPHKIKLIRETLSKLGIKNATAADLSATKLPLQGKRFTKILADVPCSGYGVISKKPESLYTKKRENLEALRRTQADILDACAEVLLPGGTLLYSTCTILREENTDRAAAFLQSHRDFAVAPLDIPANVGGGYDEIGGWLIDWREDTLDGFYLIKLRKR